MNGGEGVWWERNHDLTSRGNSSLQTTGHGRRTKAKNGVAKGADAVSAKANAGKGGGLQRVY